MGNFASKGYFTLADLDDLDGKISTLNNILTGTVKNDNTGVGDLFTYRDWLNQPKTLKISNVGIDYSHWTVYASEITSNAKTITFYQDFLYTPVVNATLVSSTGTSNWVPILQSCDTGGAQFRFCSVGTATTTGDFLLHVTAFGITRD
jgi:hypothetical protein